MGLNEMQHITHVGVTCDKCKRPVDSDDYDYYQCFETRDAAIAALLDDGWTIDEEIVTCDRCQTGGE